MIIAAGIFARLCPCAAGGVVKPLFALNTVYANAIPLAMHCIGLLVYFVIR
jgi:hypothetical protein